MSQIEKLIVKIVSAYSDHSVSFNELCKILKYFEFNVRIKGSHHIFYKEGIKEIINIQSLPDGKAKAYQVKQVRDLIIKYKLTQHENLL